MVKWKRIENGLYQRFDDGQPQNVFIDRMGRMTESGKTLVVEGWMWAEQVDGKMESTGYWWQTLREAKTALETARGFDDVQ